MSLMLVSNEVEVSLAAKIRNRMTEGAPVWELSVEEMPSWLSAAVGSQSVAAVFVSAHAGVAVLESGAQVVRSAPRN